MIAWQHLDKYRVYSESRNDPCYVITEDFLPQAEYPWNSSLLSIKG